MTQDKTAIRICEHLEKYVFDKIWNDPYSEYRTFTIPESLNEVATAGIFFGRYSQIQLPSSVSYKKSNSTLFFYLYAMPAAMFRSLRMNVKEDWVSLDKFSTNHLIDIEFFSAAGIKCTRNGIFIKQADKNDCILVAVEQTAFHGCFGSYAKSTDTFFFGEMFDSDREPSVSINCFRLTQSDLPAKGSKNPDYDPITANGKPTYTLYNGRLLTGTYNKVLTNGAFIENIVDTNIVGSVDVPTDLENAPIYREEKTADKRLLIHIPKSLNEKRVIITPNTCDIYLVPTKVKEGNGYPQTAGVYLYQCGREEYFHQLTHSDFGIDYKWITDIAEQNGFEEFYVKVFVRILDQTKRAIRDANYLNVLYFHEDDEIIGFLLGKGKYEIPFWRASHLEECLYGAATLRRRNTGKKRTLNDYIDLVGYYHTLALIGKRVTHFEVTDDSIGNCEFVVRAPLALQEYDISDYYPVVYLNGIRVPHENVSLRSGIHADNAHCKELEFTPDASWWTKVIDINYALRIRVIVSNIPIQKGDKIVVELFDDQQSGVVRHFVPSASENTIQIGDEEDWNLYFINEEPDFTFSVTDDVRFKESKVYYTKTPDGYIEASVTVGDEIDGEFYERILHAHVNNVVYHRIDNPGEYDPETKILTIDDEYYDKDLLYVEGNTTWEDSGKETITHESIGYLGKELWPDPKATMDNFPMENELVFLNDRRLIRGLDYAMEGYNPDSYHSGAKLYLQNVSYLRPETYYSVIRTNQTTLSNQRGFLQGNIVYWNHQNPFWFDELSVLTIGGNVCSNIVHEFGTITLLDSHDNGLPFEFRMTVSSKIKKMVGNYGEDVDRSRLELLKAYFDSMFKKPNYLTIVKRSHKIYSLYLEQIVTAYFSDPEFDFSLTPSNLLFEDQFIDFTDWKRRDVVFRLSPEDLKYVDIYPIFNRLQTTDRYQYHKISELAKRLLPADKYKHKDIHNVK